MLPRTLKPHIFALLAALTMSVSAGAGVITTQTSDSIASSASVSVMAADLDHANERVESLCTPDPQAGMSGIDGRSTVLVYLAITVEIDLSFRDVAVARLNFVEQTHLPSEVPMSLLKVPITFMVFSDT